MIPEARKKKKQKKGTSKKHVVSRFTIIQVDIQFSSATIFGIQQSKQAEKREEKKTSKKGDD